MGKFRKITGHVYNVENQNGFNNALYDYFCAIDKEDGKGNSYTKEKVRKMVQNFPEIYPTTIVIIDNSFECSRVYIENFDLDEESHLYKF